ncbi:helix-turn-helix domain-containing protein [Streptomyces xiamenensis]
MPAPNVGSTVPRRQLGRELRELRTASGLTMRAAAAELEWSEQKLWRIETGQTSMRRLDVKNMCDLYGARADLKEALIGLAAETKSRGWWHSYGDVIPEGFDVYISLEGAAARLDIYQAELIPGLFQTEAYARTVMQSYSPTMPEDELERRVRLRLARQALLTRADPPAVRVALSEPLLRRPVGGHTTMAGQLKHLTQVSELPTVEVRIIPVEAGLHLGVLSGPFFVMRFPLRADGRESEPATVYADGYTGDLYLDKPAEVESYDRAFGDIWSRALSEERSRVLLDDLAGRHEHG